MASSRPRQTPASRQRFHHGDLRRALLDAGRAVLADDGVDGLSLRKVAAAAGVSHAAPYHHFPDRAALLAALAEEDFHGLAAAMAAAAAGTGHDPFDRLAAIGTAYIRYAMAHPAGFALMFRPALTQPDQNPCVDAAGDSAFGVLVAAIDDCLGADAHPALRREAILGAWSTVHGVSALWLDGPLSRHGEKMGADAEVLSARIPRHYADLLKRMVASRN